MSKRTPELLLNNVAMMFIDGQEVMLRGRSKSVATTRREDVESDRFGRTISFRKLSERLSLKGYTRSKSIEPSKAEGGYEHEGSATRTRRAVSMSPTSYRRLGRPCPAPLLIEDPPSSENVSDLEDVKQQQNDPALLNGSSGNFGSAGARSAPSTPQGITGCLPGTPSDGQAATSPTSLPRSPSHHIFTKFDKGSIKQLSSSTPAMTAQAQSPEPPSPKAPSKEGKHPTTSKARQKKFNRHFPAAIEENVLNYYSCALIGDILLQGHLYITRNYFAFYSNVFGYVTKLLIPMQSVKKISKEKTARIIPNAVGITTFEDKHVFGSLMSRDSTYRFMTEVWETAKKLEQAFDEHPEPSILGPSDSDSSETREESGRESIASDITSRFRKCVKPTESFAPGYCERESKIDRTIDTCGHFKEGYFKLATASKQSVLLITTTFILILLFLSAAVLLYRIGKVQNKYTQALQDNLVLSESEDVYSELLQWQTHLHSKSAGAVHSFLDTNLDQIAKVRQSLEALSTLLIPNGHSASQNTATKQMETPENS